MKRLARAALAPLILALGLSACGKLHYVDQAPFSTFAGAYFAKLQAGDIPGALTMYSPQFTEKYGETWSYLLPQLQSKLGKVSSYSLARSNIVPLEAGKKVCAQLQYDVLRGTAKSIESLLVCPGSGAGGYEIAGHSLSNPATGQNISGGTLVQFTGS